MNLTTPVYALKAIEPFPITFVDGNQNPRSNQIAHKRNSHAEHRKYCKKPLKVETVGHTRVVGFKRGKTQGIKTRLVLKSEWLEWWH